MSTTFWKDVRLFHKALNLAHDGVLTSTELQVTFPKVLEGTFGLQTGGLSNQAYKEHLEAYLNRLYTAAYPDYFLRKLVRAQQQHLSSPSPSKLDPTNPVSPTTNPTETRNQLPLLLSHFEQDFIAGLSKEEEAVLHVDLKHSLKALDTYYHNIDRNVEKQIERFFPIIIRGLTNTSYLTQLPQSKEPALADLLMGKGIVDNLDKPNYSEIVDDLIIYFDQTNIQSVLSTSEHSNNIDATYIVQQDGQNTIHKYTYHIPLSKIRILFVALGAFMYDSQKVTAMTRINKESHQNNENLQQFLNSVPDLLTPGVVIQPHTPILSDGLEFDVFKQMMASQGNLGGVMNEIMQVTSANPSQLTTAQLNPPLSEQPQTTIPAPDLSQFVKGLGPHTQQTSSPSSSLSTNKSVIHATDGFHKMADAPMQSDVINIAFKYFLYSLAFQTHLDHLITFPHQVYNPLTATSNMTGYTQITEADCTNAKKSEKERAVLLKIRQEQLELMEKSEKSKEIQLPVNYSLKQLLNVIFRCYSSTMDISKSIVKINDYIGEVTYGNENDEEDQELMNMLKMMMTTGSSLTPQQQPFPSQSDPEQSKTTTTASSIQNESQITACYEETVKLMNAEWLPPIRLSINWSQAFTVHQLVPTSTGASSRQMMLMGRLNQANGDGPAMFNAAVQLHAEETMQERHEDFDLAHAMRSRKYGGH